MKKAILIALIGLPILILASGFGMAKFSSAPDLTSFFTTGQFPPLTGKPNSVSTLEAGEYEQMSAIAYDGNTAVAKEKLLDILTTMERMTLEKDTETAVHATFRSPTFQFVDDVLFYFDEDAKEIHFYAAARSGQSDMGVNQSGMKKISEEMAKE